MKNSKVLIAAISVVMVAALSGCGGSSDSRDSQGMLPGTMDARVLHSYPRQRVRDQGQPYMPWRVPRTTPYIITFDKSVYGLEEEVKKFLRRPYQSGGEMLEDTIVESEYRYADRGRTLIMVPSEKLEPFTEYSATWDKDLPGHSTTFFRKFETDGAYEGSKEETSIERYGNHTFRALHSIPHICTTCDPKNAAYPLYPFGSYIMTFTQPLDENSVVYGAIEDGAFRFERLDDNSQPVEMLEARSIATAGKTIVFTPEEPFEDGGLYRVNFNQPGDEFVITSVYGDELEGHVSASFRTYFKAQRVALDDERWPRTGVISFTGGRSNITDSPLNQVPGNSDLAFGGHMAMEYDYIPENAGWDRARSPFRIMLDTVGAESAESVTEFLLGGPLPEIVQQSGYRLAILSEPVGTFWWYSDDPWSSQKNLVEMDMIIGLVSPDGEVVEKDYVQFQGLVDGSHTDGSFTFSPVGIFNPAVLRQPDEPGNGVLHLQMTFTQLPDPNS